MKQQKNSKDDILLKLNTLSKQELLALRKKFDGVCISMQFANIGWFALLGIGIIKSSLPLILAPIAGFIATSACAFKFAGKVEKCTKTLDKLEVQEKKEARVPQKSNIEIDQHNTNQPTAESSDDYNDIKQA